MTIYIHAYNQNTILNLTQYYSYTRISNCMTLLQIDDHAIEPPPNIFIKVMGLTSVEGRCIHAYVTHRVK